MIKIRIFPAVIAYLLLFATLLVMALPNGMKTELSLKKDSPDCTPYLKEVLFSCRADRPLTPLSTLDDIISVYQQNDHASYARAAKTSYKSVAAFWPPGLIVLEGLFYSLSTTFPIGLGLAPIACALWAGAMTALWSISYRNTSSFLLSFVPAFLLVMCLDMRSYLGAGLFVGETYGVAGFLLGIGVLVNLLDRYPGSNLLAGVAGAAFAIAAYFRAQYDQLMVIVTGLLIIISLAWFVGRYFKAVQGLGFRREAVNLLQVLLIAVCTYHVLTLPYRLTHYLGWIDSSNLVVWRLTWEKPELFTGERSFFLRGGGAAGCFLDPERCQLIWDQLPSKDPGTLLNDWSSSASFSNADLQKYTIRSFLDHPIAWVSFKAPYILRGIVDTGKAIPLAAFFVIVLGGTIFIRTPRMLVLSFFLVVTSVTVIGPLFLIHLEPRYLDPLTTLIPFAAIVALSGYLGAMRKIGTGTGI